MAWTPASSGAYTNLMHWYDASDASTITLSGSDVTQWDDKKGTADLTVEAGSPAQSFTLNSLNTVAFDGTDIMSAAADYVGASGYNYAIFVVRTHGSPGGYFYAYSADDTGGEVFAASAYDNGNNRQFTARYYNGAVDTGSTWALNEGEMASFGISQGAQHNTTAFRHNGLAITHGAGGTNTITVQTSPDIVFGADRVTPTNTASYDGEIAEFLLFKVDPTTAQKEEIEGYLAHKWGTNGKLPAGHTYKSAPPADPDATALPGVGSVTTTGFAPDVSVGTNATASPGAGSIAVLGFAPTVAAAANATAAPGAGSVSVLGFAPTAAVGTNATAVPGTGSVAVLGFAPTTSATASYTAAPGAGTIAILGFAPVVAIIGPVAVPSGTMEITGNPAGVVDITGNPAPVVTLTGNPAAIVEITGNAK